MPRVAPPHASPPSPPPPAPGAGAGPSVHLAQLIAKWAPAEGRTESAWPGLRFYRASCPSVRAPVVYEPSLFVVAQGRKRAFLGDRVYTYDPWQYLVLAVPLPVEGEIFEATPEEPYLSLSLAIETPMLTDLLLEMAAVEPSRSARPPVRPGIFVSRMSEPLAAGVARLLGALDSPLDHKILAPLAVREILYHVLAGEQGDLLRSVVQSDSHSQRIAQVLRFLNTHYVEPLEIAAIARAARMSPSTLHHTFKAVTSVSPLQYLKQIRLHQARLLMLQDGLNAGEVAHRVGYSSPSQFSREFKRFFGAPPVQEVQRLREAS